jgi:hypothetical protein
VTALPVEGHAALLALQEAHAFDPAPLRSGLRGAHVPFDEMTGTPTCEAVLDRAVTAHLVRTVARYLAEARRISRAALGLPLWAADVTIATELSSVVIANRPAPADARAHVDRAAGAR